MADQLSTIFAFAALGLLVIILLRNRRRIKCLEIERNKAFAIKRDPVEDYNEAKVVKLVDICRELEARVQNKASLLEALIEDADKKIKELENKKSKTESTEKITEMRKEKRKEKRDSSSTMYDRVLTLSKEGKDEQEIGKLINRSAGEVKVLLSLGRQSSQEN
jgi:hypothetical protein